MFRRCKETDIVKAMENINKSLEPLQVTSKSTQGGGLIQPDNNVKSTVALGEKLQPLGRNTRAV